MAEDPEFITYLLNPDDRHDCYFLVGNSTMAEPQKIGVVKKMLLANSIVLRSELQDSEIAEKGIVAVKDVYPDTFRNLLRFVYGYDTTISMSFEDADNLLYVAEKYMMQRLKDKLANRLMVLMSYDNICNLMNNPACYRHLELNSAITKILQCETDKVLISPQFLDLCPEAFIKILEQERSTVREIELWRAALKWAKHKADTEDSDALRAQLTPCLQHLRLCTLSLQELCQEVTLTRILSYAEIGLITLAIVNKEQQSELTYVCKTIHPRTVVSNILQVNFQTSGSIQSTTSTFTLSTYDYCIELLPFEFKANTLPRSIRVPVGLTYVCECTIEVTRITDYSNDTCTEPPVTISFNEAVKYGEKFHIPITHSGYNLQLLSGNKYNIKVLFSQSHDLYYNNHIHTFEHKHFYIDWGKCDWNASWSIPINPLKYRIVS